MNKCILHNSTITHFCQSCLDIICEECLKNSHSDKLHKIESLEKAFTNRVTYIQNYLNTDVKTKRNSLLIQISKINQRIQDILKTSKTIKNDVLVEIEGLNLRLDNSESEKVVKFQSQIKRLQHLVNIVDDIFYAFQESMKVPEKFLLLYKQFKQRITGVDVYRMVDFLTGDHIYLPEQFKRTQQKILVSQTIQKQSNFITEILKRVLLSYKETLKAYELKIREKQSKIIQQYFNMNQKLIAHNFSLSKSCYFCGMYLSLSNINTICNHNRPFKIGQTRSTTFIQAPTHIRGTKRHHWVAQKKQLAQNKQIQNNKLHLILILMRKNLYQKSCTINDIFKSQDEKLSGEVNQLVFSYILSNKLQLQQNDIDILIKSFYSSNGNISYQRLNDLIKDKQYLDQPVSAISQQKPIQVIENKKRYAY